MNSLVASGMEGRLSVLPPLRPTQGPNRDQKWLPCFSNARCQQPQNQPFWISKMWKRKVPNGGQLWLAVPSPRSPFSMLTIETLARFLFPLLFNAAWVCQLMRPSFLSCAGAYQPYKTGEAQCDGTILDLFFEARNRGLCEGKKGFENSCAGRMVPPPAPNNNIALMCLRAS